MSTDAPSETAPKPTAPAQEPVVETAPTEIDWKAKAREWETRAKANKTAADELAAIKESQKSEAEKVAERLAVAERKAAEADARVLRRDVAIEHSLSADDAALLDAITDEAAMRSLAKRLAGKSVDEKKRGAGVPGEGTTTPRPPEDELRGFARDLFKRAE